MYIYHHKAYCQTTSKPHRALSLVPDSFIIIIGHYARVLDSENDNEGVGYQTKGPMKWFGNKLSGDIYVLTTGTRLTGP